MKSPGGITPGCEAMKERLTRIAGLQKVLLVPFDVRTPPPTVPMAARGRLLNQPVAT